VIVNIQPSPSEHLSLACYDEAAFPKFRRIFEQAPPESPLSLVARDPSEASAAIVLENRSNKALTALYYCWELLEESGKRRPQRVCNDSYLVDVYQAIATPHSRLLISPWASVDETLLEHLEAGGGVAVVEARTSSRAADEVVEARFEIDFVLFEDGEIAGPDPQRYVAQLTSRKPAAEFIARQVRLAIAENRDVTPVLSALAEIPCLSRREQVQGDPLVHWVRHYAREYLAFMRRQISGVDWRESGLRHLENRPKLPAFYRRTK
jgi:hypothetical protein